MTWPSTREQGKQDIEHFEVIIIKVEPEFEYSEKRSGSMRNILPVRNGDYVDGPVQIWNPLGRG
jgi:hypothetical protein